MAQQNEREWSSGLFGCCSDIKSCICAYFCMPCTLCKLAGRMNENCCTAWAPGGLVAMRTKMRTMHGIEGSICGDCCAIQFCGACAVCQLEREMDHVGM